jgi:hypothetical protein
MSFIDWFNNNNNHQINNDQIISNFSSIWGLISTISDEPTFDNNQTIFLNESSPKVFFDNTNNTLNGQGLGAITVSKDTHDNTIYTLNKDVTIVNLLERNNSTVNIDSNKNKFMVLNFNEIFDGNGFTITISGEIMPGLFNHSLFSDEKNNSIHTEDNNRMGFLVKNLKVIPTGYNDNNVLKDGHGVIIASNRYLDGGSLRNINYNFTIRDCIIEKGKFQGNNCGSFVGYDDCIIRNNVNSFILIENCVSKFNENIPVLGKQVGGRDNTDVTLKNCIITGKYDTNTPTGQIFIYESSCENYPSMNNCYIFDSSNNKVLKGNNNNEKLIMFNTTDNFDTKNKIILNDGIQLISGFNSGFWKNVYLMPNCIPDFSNNLSEFCAGEILDVSFFPNVITKIPHFEPQRKATLNNSLYDDILIINWNIQGYFENFKIEIYKDNTLFYIIEKNISVNNLKSKETDNFSVTYQYRWQVPPMWYLFETPLKIKIIDIRNDILFSISTNTFIIDIPPKIPDLSRFKNSLPIEKLETTFDIKYKHKPIFTKKAKSAFIVKDSNDILESDSEDESDKVMRKTLSYAEFIKKKTAVELVKTSRNT